MLTHNPVFSFIKQSDYDAIQSVNIKIQVPVSIMLKIIQKVGNVFLYPKVLVVYRFSSIKPVQSYK